MSFDQFQRYKTIQIIVGNIKRQTGKDRVSILEIGGNGQCNLEEMLPEEQIQYSNLTIPKEREGDQRFIALDGTDMPEIEENAYDIVIALDVFEHVAPDRRDKFLKEIYRVAGDMAIICFPFANGYNEGAEKRVNDYYKAIYGKEHIWLEEHIGNGLPNLEDVKQVLKKEGMEYFLFEHGDIYMWEEWMKALFATYDIPAVAPYLHGLEEYYEQNIYLHDIGENNYRVFLLLSDDKQMLKNMSKELGMIFGEDRGNSRDKRKHLYRGLDDLKALCGRKACEKVVSSLYIDEGEGYSEERKQIMETMAGDACEIHISCEFAVPENSRGLRFDPVEGCGCLVSHIRIDSNEGKLSYTPADGWERDGMYIFVGRDPQFIIDVKNKKINLIKIEAELIIFQEEKNGILLECAGKIISDYEKRLLKAAEEKMQVLEEKEQAIAEKEQAIGHYEAVQHEMVFVSEQKDILIKEKEELTELLAEQRAGRELYEEAYNSVIRSRTWKISAPFRKVFGKK